MYVPISFETSGKPLHLPEPQLSSLNNGYGSTSLEWWQGKRKQHLELSTYIRLGCPGFGKDVSQALCSTKSSGIIIFWSWLLRQDFQTVKDGCRVSQHKASTVHQRTPLVQLPRLLRLKHLSILLCAPIVGSSGTWWQFWQYICVRGSIWGPPGIPSQTATFIKLLLRDTDFSIS